MDGRKEGRKEGGREGGKIGKEGDEDMEKKGMTRSFMRERKR